MTEFSLSPPRSADDTLGTIEAALKTNDVVLTITTPEADAWPEPGALRRLGGYVLRSLAIWRPNEAIDDDFSYLLEIDTAAADRHVTAEIEAAQAVMGPAKAALPKRRQIFKGPAVERLDF